MYFCNSASPQNLQVYFPPLDGDSASSIGPKVFSAGYNKLKGMFVCVHCNCIEALVLFSCAYSGSKWF